jgi:flagellar basal-body rod modification protein FlgD
MVTSPIPDIPAPTARAAPATSRSTEAAEALTSDFDTFLTLLTAQIRHQDPLKPVDNTEFVAQLATFSNVEQAIRGNELLEGIAARLDRQDMAAAGAWIGLEVRHGGAVPADRPTVLHADVPAAADRAELVATDENGTEVLRRAIDPEAATFEWPVAGIRLPAGNYALHVESAAGERSLKPSPVSHYAAVTEVMPGEDGLDLVLDTGLRTPAAGLEAVRSAAD